MFKKYKRNIATLKMGFSPLTSKYLHQARALAVSTKDMAESGGSEAAVGSISGIKYLPFVRDLGNLPFCPLRVSL